MSQNTGGRLFALVIAALAWTGLLLQSASTYAATGSLTSALWVLIAYFTILTNVLVAVVFTALALNYGRFFAGWIVAGTMLSIVLVGAVNALLLWGALELSGGSRLVDRLLHVVTPVLVPVYWFLFTPKGKLQWQHLPLWSIYPLTYLAFAIARGLATGNYPYPFLNVSALGWERVTLNALLIALGFLAAGAALILLDRSMASHGPRPALPVL